MKGTKKFLLGGALLVSCLAGVTGATSRKAVLLWDRLGDFHLVVVARPGAIEVVEVGGAHRSVAMLHVEEVLKGSGATAGGKLSVQWGHGASQREVAVNFAAAAPKDRAIWVLELMPESETVAGGPSYRVMYRNRPDHERNWAPYLASIRERAVKYAAWEGLQLSVAIDPGEIRGDVPCQATVLLSVPANRGTSLPQTLEWSRNLRVELELVPDGFALLPAFEDMSVPRFEVQNARPFTSGEIPRELSAGSEFAARLSLMPKDIEPERGLPYRVVAKLVDDGLNTIVTSRPILVRVVPTQWSDADRAAHAAIGAAGIWPLAGPHIERVSGERLETLRALLDQYPDSIYAPALEVGLLFAGHPSPTDERVAALTRLGADTLYGFADDLRLETARLLSANDPARARALLDDLKHAELSPAWRSAIDELRAQDPEGGTTDEGD